LVLSVALTWDPEECVRVVRLISTNDCDVRTTKFHLEDCQVTINSANEQYLPKIVLEQRTAQ